MMMGPVPTCVPRLLHPFVLLFIPPFMPTPTSTALNPTHITLPGPIFVFHSRKHNLFFSPPFKIKHPISRHISFVSSKHLSAGFFHSPQPTTKTCTKDTFSHSSQARTHARIPAWTIYVSIPPGGIYLAQKKKDFVTEDASRITPELKKFVRSEQIHHSLSYPPYSTKYKLKVKKCIFFFLANADDLEGSRPPIVINVPP